MPENIFAWHQQNSDFLSLNFLESLPVSSEFQVTASFRDCSSQGTDSRPYPQGECQINYRSKAHNLMFVFPLFWANSGESGSWCRLHPLCCKLLGCILYFKWVLWLFLSSFSPFVSPGLFDCSDTWFPHSHHSFQMWYFHLGWQFFSLQLMLNHLSCQVWEYCSSLHSWTAAQWREGRVQTLIKRCFYPFICLFQCWKWLMKNRSQKYMIKQIS